MLTARSQLTALITFAALLSVAPLLNAAEIAAGPMLGHLEMREATVWVQTDAPATVRVNYTEAGNGTAIWSQAAQTDPSLANTATLTLDQIEPGKTYSYQLEVDGALTGARTNFTSPPFYHDRTPPPDLRIAVGGAHYATQEGFEPPYKILGDGYGIFNTILENKPELMIWAGNTAHLRPSDWASQSGYLKRFSHARAHPQLQPLLAAIPHYAIWSHRDYALTDEGKYYSYRDFAETAFNAFWPQPVQVDSLDGISTRFRRSDVDFFMLDVRSFRDDIESAEKLPAILGAEQIEWLRQELNRSTATFKIIVAGAPVLNPADSPDNMSRATSEHTALLEMFRSEKISGLFFISGGKYHGELTRMLHASSYNLFDLTVGPLTANPQETDELNFFRMPASNVNARHFALIDFTGPEEDRQLTIRMISKEGEELWNRTIKASQLQPAI